MVNNTREYALPSWPQIIRHLLRVKELDKLRNKQLEQFHTSRTESLQQNLTEVSSTFRSLGIKQSLKKMLWEHEVTHLQDPFIVPQDPNSSQAALSLRLNLKWIKALGSLAEKSAETEQILLELQHLNTKELSEISLASSEDTTVHAVLSKKELDQSFFNHLLNILSSSTSNTLIANLLSSHHEMHSLAFAILNEEDLWLHDPFKGSFLCKDKEKLRDFFMGFCHENYPEHKEASIVQPGAKLKQDLSSKSLTTTETPAEKESRKNFLISTPSVSQEKTQKPSDESSKPEHKSRGPGSFKK